MVWSNMDIMKKRKRKAVSEQKKTEIFHIIVFVAVCLVVILSLALLTGKDVVDEKVAQPVVLVEPKITEMLDNSTGDEYHTVDLGLRNILTVPVNCSLNLTIINETYKNSTLFEVGVLEPEQLIPYNISFTMPRGESEIVLTALC